MKKPLLITLLAVAFVASSLLMAVHAANAQNAPGHVQHRVNFMTKLLSLTPAQQQQATTIFTNAQATEKTVHGNMKAAHEGLQQAIVSNNAAAIDQSAVTIGNLMTQGISTRAKAEAAFYQILTPEQQAKLTEFEKTHHHGRHRMEPPPDGPQGQ